jgi:predicted permease
VQLVLVESAWLALLAAAMGAVFAWWSAPFVVSRINPPDNPARLFLPADWRVLAFGLVLAAGVTFLFGLAPALYASAVKPMAALKGGEDPHSRRRLMHALIAVQVAFCFLVLFVGSLFVATFRRLADQPTGFSAERLLTVEARVAPGGAPPVLWRQAAEHLRGLPGIEKVALAGWPLLSGAEHTPFISANGRPPSEVRAALLPVSPGWAEAMRIPFLDGRDFRDNEAARVAIVSETFAKQYFSGENPIGKSFAIDRGFRTQIQIVGLVGDARYRNLREPFLPVAYVPFEAIDARAISLGSFLVRSSGPNSLALAPLLRREVPRAGHGFRVSNIRIQKEINESQTVRERLLAMMALFFAAVALLLAAVGLYGVLHYSVLQRRREIGIRLALGASARDVARRVTMQIFGVVLAGAAAGLAAGMAAVRYIEALLYQVKATDLAMLALPSLAILAAAVLAALPAVIHAVRIDPVTIMRVE